MTILVAGCCLGWAWGCAAVAAAYRARDKALYQRTLQGLAQSVAPDFRAGFFLSNMFGGGFTGRTARISTPASLDYESYMGTSWIPGQRYFHGQTKHLI